MANSTCTLLPCGDTPLAIASSVTSFVTTFVAVAFAYWGFYNVFLGVPEAILTFRRDMDLFQSQLFSLGEGLGLTEEREADLSGVSKESEKALRKMLEGARETLEKASNFVKDSDIFPDPRSLENPNMFEFFENLRRPRRSLLTQLQVSIHWWWSGKSDTSDLMADIATHRSILSWLERDMIRRSILEMTAGLKDMKADQRALAPPVPLSPIPTPSLSNTSVLITGGASGLGLATVRALAAAGAHITVATNVPTAPSILSSLQASGYHVQEVLCDVADWDSLHRTFKDALAFSPTGALDVVAIFASVDNGPNLIDHVDRLHAEEEPKPPSTAELDVNLKGSLYTSALALHYFRGEAGKGRDKSLIFVSSLAGYIDDTHNSVYTASKFGMRGLWRSIRARAGAEMGVRCNLIAPWAIKTPMTAPIIEVTDKMGIKEGEGITFAKEETVVEAVTRCIGDKSVSGRAFAIMPEGFFDIGDDVEGVYGGEVLRELMSMRRKAGDYLQG